MAWLKLWQYKAINKLLSQFSDEFQQKAWERILIWAKEQGIDVSKYEQQGSKEQVSSNIEQRVKHLEEAVQGIYETVQLIKRKILEEKVK